MAPKLDTMDCTAVDRPRHYVVKTQSPLPLKRIVLRFERALVMMGQPRGYWSSIEYAPEIHATILACKSGEDEEEDEELLENMEGLEIGRIKAWMLKLGRIQSDGQSLWEICDEDSAELSDMYLALFRGDESDEDDHDDDEMDEDDANMYPTRAEFTKYLNSGGDLLYISKVHLKREYRGYGISLLAVDALIRGLPSFHQGSVVLSPYGLTAEQEERRYNKEEVIDRHVVSAKLRQHWNLIGFERWIEDSSSGCLMGLWTGNKDPKIENVVPHLIDK